MKFHKKPSSLTLNSEKFISRFRRFASLFCKCYLSLKAHFCGADWMNKTMSMNRIRHASVVSLFIEISNGENDLTLFFLKQKSRMKEHNGFVLAFLQRLGFCW